MVFGIRILNFQIILKIFNILESANRFVIPQSNIVNPIRKQLLNLIDGNIVLLTFFNLENFKIFFYLFYFICLHNI